MDLREEVVVEELVHVKVDVGPILKTFIRSINSIVVVPHRLASVLIVGRNSSEL